MRAKRELNEIINRLRYQLKAIIRKLNIKYQYIDSEDLYQEVLLYLWQQNENGKLKDKNDSYILQGSYYHLKNHIRKSIKSEYKQINHSYYQNITEENREYNDHRQLNYQHSTYHSLDEYLYYDEFNTDLSIKERALLGLRMRGLSNREIGKELGVSHTMVSKMRRKMIEKYQSLNQ